MSNDPRNVRMSGILPFSASAYNRILSRLRSYFSSKGTAEPQLTATMLHIARETGGSFDPLQREVGQRRGRGGFGIMQWTADRALHFVKYAQANSLDASDLDVQIDYLIMELENDPVTFKGGTDPYGWSSNTRRRRFFQTDDLDEAVLALLHGFIRPAFSFTKRGSRTVVNDSPCTLR